MPDHESDPSTVASVARAFDVLEALEGTEGVRVTDLAAALDLPKSTVHRHLKTLEAAEFVSRDGNEYYLGLRFLYYGTIARNRYDPRSIVHKGVRYVAEQTKERAQFMVREHGSVIYLYRELGERAVRTDTMVGKRMPVHATSGGKAILAHRPETERRRFVEDHELPAYTETTITDERRLMEELRTIRQTGVSTNDQEYIDGLRAVSVPVRTDGGVVGSIGVSGPSHRLTGETFERELPDLLLGVANEIELKYTHDIESSG